MGRWAAGGRHPEHLRLFLSRFDQRIVGLTGELDEIQGLAEAFGASFAKSPIGVDYAIDHSTKVYVVDRSGFLSDELPYDLPETDEVARLRALVQRT